MVISVSSVYFVLCISCCAQRPVKPDRRKGSCLADDTQRSTDLEKCNIRHETETK